MQLLKLALPLAFVSALVSVSAAPVQQRRDALTSPAQHARSFEGELDLQIREDQPEKRLWALGARVGVGLLNLAQRVINSNKEAIEDGTFDVDTYLKSAEGKEFVSKAASLQKRGLESEIEQPEKRLWALGARVGLGLLNLAQRVINRNKEAIEDGTFDVDTYLKSDAGKEFVSKAAALQQRSLDNDFDMNEILSRSEVQPRYTDFNANLDLLGLLHSQLNVNV